VALRQKDLYQNQYSHEELILPSEH